MGKLAEQFAGHPRISIASFDVEANEAPAAALAGRTLDALPSVLLFGAGKGGEGAPPIDYDEWSVVHNKGERDVAGLSRFITEKTGESAAVRDTDGNGKGNGKKDE